MKCEILFNLECSDNNRVNMLLKKLTNNAHNISHVLLDEALKRSVAWIFALRFMREL